MILQGTFKDVIGPTFTLSEDEEGWFLHRGGCFGPFEDYGPFESLEEALEFTQEEYGGNHKQPLIWQLGNEA
jgi:hypothetical protein